MRDDYDAVLSESQDGYSVDIITVTCDHDDGSRGWCIDSVRQHVHWVTSTSIKLNDTRCARTYHHLVSDILLPIVRAICERYPARLQVRPQAGRLGRALLRVLDVRLEELDGPILVRDLSYSVDHTGSWDPVIGGAVLWWQCRGLVDCIARYEKVDGRTVIPEDCDWLTGDVLHEVAEKELVQPQRTGSPPLYEGTMRLQGTIQTVTTPPGYSP